MDAMLARSLSVPVGLCLSLGLGGLATAAIGPLYSTFVPPMARAAVANGVIVGGIALGHFPASRTRVYSVRPAR